MSWERSIALLLGGAAAGVAAYDYIRGKMFPTLSVDEIRGRKGQRVSSAEYVRRAIKMKPLKRPPIVITSVDQIGPMLKDMDLEDQKESITKIVRNVTELSENALAVEGEKHDYLILPAKVNRMVVEHELGHLRAKEEKKDEPAGFIDRLASLFWKPSFRKTTLGPEEEAWRYVGRKSELQRKALGSYEKGFHEDRSGTLGRLGAVLLLGGLLTPP